jgi:hypothetical protein
VKGTDPETGQIVHFRQEEIEAQGGIPSFDQFQYWSNKDHLRLEIKRKRMGSKLYDKDLRGLLGTSNAQVIGPGSRYQIDATIADVYLVSRLDPNLIIGRPIVYVVIDVFSRLITGVYIGLEGPSWVSAMMALANTAMDKVAYCAQYGVAIRPEDWPAHHLPGIELRGVRSRLRMGREPPAVGAAGQHGCRHQQSPCGQGTQGRGSKGKKRRLGHGQT